MRSCPRKSPIPLGTYRSALAAEFLSLVLESGKVDHLQVVNGRTVKVFLRDSSRGVLDEMESLGTQVRPLPLPPPSRCSHSPLLHALRPHWCECLERLFEPVLYDVLLAIASTARIVKRAALACGGWVCAHSHVALHGTTSAVVDTRVADRPARRHSVANGGWLCLGLRLPTAGGRASDQACPQAPQLPTAGGCASALDKSSQSPRGQAGHGGSLGGSCPPGYRGLLRGSSRTGGLLGGPARQEFLHAARLLGSIQQRPTSEY